MESQEHLPGVYFLARDGEVVYVGQSINPRQRIFQHINEGQKVFDQVFIRHCQPDELDLIESMFIQELLPEYNFTMVNGQKISPILVNDLQEFIQKLHKPKQVTGPTTPQAAPVKQAPTQYAQIRLIRLPEVLQLVGVQKSTLYLMMKQGTFPAPTKLSMRAVCWPLHEVERWIENRIGAREIA